MPTASHNLGAEKAVLGAILVNNRAEERRCHRSPAGVLPPGRRDHRFRIRRRSYLCAWSASVRKRFAARHAIARTAPAFRSRRSAATRHSAMVEGQDGEISAAQNC